MQFPFTFVFEAPTRADLRDAARRPRLWALAVGLCLLVAGVIILARAHRAAQALPADAELAVTSTPADAAILIDGGPPSLDSFASVRSAPLLRTGLASSSPDPGGRKRELCR